MFLSFSFSKIGLSFFFLDPPLLLASFLYIASILVLILTAVLLLPRVSGIFFPYFIGFLTFLSWDSNGLGVTRIFQVVYAPLMWHKLGKNPFINAEVKIFLLLASSRSFLWLLVSSRGHTLIIRASRLG